MNIHIFKVLYIYWMTCIFILQQNLLNVITLGQTKSDTIYRMITITDDFYLQGIFSKWDI